MGVDIIVIVDGMIICGNIFFYVVLFDCYGDYRIGMMIVIVVFLVKEGEVDLFGEEVINISYFNFLEYLEGLVNV